MVMLKLIIGVLIFLALLLKFSSKSASLEPVNPSAALQQECMDQKRLYNCEKETSKTNPYWKIC